MIHLHPFIKLFPGHWRCVFLCCEKCLNSLTDSELIKFVKWQRSWSAITVLITLPNLKHQDITQTICLCHYMTQWGTMKNTFMKHWLLDLLEMAKFQLLDDFSVYLWHSISCLPVSCGSFASSWYVAGLIFIQSDIETFFF
jgi:hypothetical protein